MAREGQVRLPGHDPAWLRNVGYLDPGVRKEPERLPDSGGLRLHGSVRTRGDYIRLVWSWLIIIGAGATAVGAAQALFQGHW